MPSLRLREQQVAVVTGAASGIGLALVEAFFMRGMNVAAIDIRPTPLKSEWTRESGASKVCAYCADVADDQSLRDTKESVLEDFGAVDVLCNNAGVFMAPVPFWEQSAEDFGRVMAVNFGGVVNGIRNFLPHMVERGSGHVVNTASYLGLVTRPGGGNAAYVAGKHAVVGLSQVLTEELGRLGINIGVTTLCPGPVETAGFRESSSKYAKTESPLTVVSADEVAAATIAAIESGIRLVVLGDDTADFVAMGLTRLREEIARPRSSVRIEADKEEENHGADLQF
jgi:NAD(P)-dependent dehydrogenase (short-subunit alcohol dehydrogenase family)